MGKLDPLVDRVKDTFCPAPWVEAHISVTGDVHPCCYHDLRYPYGNVKKTPLPELLNSKTAKKLRKDLATGTRNHGCANCWRDEDLHGKSYRKDYLNGWNATIHKPIYHTDEYFQINPNLLEKLDLRFDNKCNLKCRICGPMYSTSWFKDAKDLKSKYKIGEGSDRFEYSISIDDKLFDSLLGLLGSIRLLFFAGGEPLIQEKHYQILQYAIDNGYAKNITLQYNTNFTKLNYKNYDLKEMWPKFKKVTVIGSLDDSKERGEYQRKNLIWSEIVENRKKLFSYNNVEFGICATVSIFNVIHILDFIQEWVELNYLNTEKQSALQINILSGPPYLDICNLPKNYKDSISRQYKSFINKYSSNDRFINIIPEITKIHNQLQVPPSIPESRWAKEFLRNIESLDELRKESFTEIFPEYKQLIESIKNDQISL